MSISQTRIIVRWGLLLALAAVGLLFTFSGFVTGIFATARPADKVGLLWQNQARFRLALGSTLWLAAALAFIILRRGGALVVFRGGDFGSTKRWLYLIVLGSLLLISIYSWLDLLRHT